VLISALRPFLDQSLLTEQQRLASARVIDMPDGDERNRLIHFISAAGAARMAFIRALSAADRKTLADLEDRRFFRTVQITHAIFREHGYNLLPELDALDAWQTMTDRELSEAVPAVDVGMASRLADFRVHLSDLRTQS